MMRADRMGTLEEAELLRLYREGTREERQDARRELDRRRHAADVARARPRPASIQPPPPRHTPHRWRDGRAAAAGEDE